MLTLGQAKKLRPGDYVYATYSRYSHPERERWKVNGKVKTWKRDESRIHVPLKHGLYSYDSLQACHFGAYGFCAMVSLESELVRELRSLCRSHTQAPA